MEVVYLVYVCYLFGSFGQVSLAFTLSVLGVYGASLYLAFKDLERKSLIEPQM